MFFQKSGLITCSSSVGVAANSTVHAAEAGAAAEAQRAVDPATLLQSRRHRPLPLQVRERWFVLVCEKFLHAVA